jgi:hypothetical protein
MGRFLVTLAAAAVGVSGCGGSRPLGFAPPGVPGVDAASDDGATADASGSADSTSSDANRDAGLEADADAGDGNMPTFNFGDAHAANGCPPEAMLVYITGPGSDLWSFYPPTLQFTLIGTMTCLPSGPTHMTVDRQGFAWVLSGGKLYKASTRDASCSPVATWTPQSMFPDFALTFLGSTSQPDNTLYILGNSIVQGFFSPSGAPLSRFDVAMGTVTSVGLVPVPSAAGDMTSPGDGALYFLIPGPTTIFKIDPSSAGILQTFDAGVQGAINQGFAFWGGSFYLFENGVINRFDPKTQASTSLGMAPITVTGAGQSTCVPMVPPPLH